MIINVLITMSVILINIRIFFFFDFKEHNVITSIIFSIGTLKTKQWIIHKISNSLKFTTIKETNKFLWLAGVIEWSQSIRISFCYLGDSEDSPQKVDTSMIPGSSTQKKCNGKVLKSWVACHKNAQIFRFITIR